MLTDCLENALEPTGVSVDEFSELAVRLLNYGVLCRGENQVEQLLYDRYVRIAPVMDAYLGLIGVRVLHDRRFEYVRLYPPGAQVPGMEQAEEGAFSGSLRARLRQDEVALLLVLRLQYDKALSEGEVDENGYVAESMESLGIAMKNLLGRSLPDKLTERKRVFQRLRQLRLIDYRQEEDIEVDEAWLRIHPMIMSFVGDEALASLEQGLPEQGIEGEDDDVS
jgi:hypothetical protein